MVMANTTAEAQWMQTEFSICAPYRLRRGWQMGSQKQSVVAMRFESSTRMIQLMT